MWENRPIIAHGLGKLLPLAWNGSATISKSATSGTISSGGLTSVTSGAGSAATAGTYSGVAVASTDGSGSGATFDISINASGTITNIVLASGGDDYQVGDEVKLAKANIGSPLSDLVITLTSVELTSVNYAEVNTGENAFQSGETYVKKFKNFIKIIKKNSSFLLRKLKKEFKK